MATLAAIRAVRDVNGQGHLVRNLLEYDVVIVETQNEKVKKLRN